MLKKTIATALIFTGMTFVPAAMAAHGGGGHGGGGVRASAARSVGPSVRSSGASAARVYGWRSGGGARHAFHRRGRGVDVYAYDGDYGYGGCGYLYSRAVATGSSYWWRRYEECEG
jgi:hypothetical protein